MTKRKTLLLASLAVALVLGMGIAPAWSYFTDSHTTNGGLPISVKPSTTPHEWFADSTKHLTIKNSDDATAPVFIRAGVFSSNKLPITSIRGTGWSAKDAGDWGYDVGDGWYYYGSSSDGRGLTPLAPGDTTEELLVVFNFPQIQSADQPEGIPDGDNYNAIIVYESTPVQYDAEGNPYADWNIAANVASEHVEE